MSMVLGIDVGGTFTRYGFVDELYRVSESMKILTINIHDFKEFVIGLVIDHPDIDAISIGIPGIVMDNKILSVPNIENLDFHNLDEELIRSINRPVYINKDVNLLFINDIYSYDLHQNENVLGFYLGTGLGNAIKIMGKLLKGTHGFSGELGHVPLIGNDLLCGCGKVGCSETLVSGRALIRLYEQMNLEGDFKDIFTLHSKLPQIVEFVDNFAKMIAMEINILDIVNIIIGGGVVNMNGFPKEYLNKCIMNLLRSDILESELEIIYVDDNPERGIIGAARIIKEL